MIMIMIAVKALSYLHSMSELLPPSSAPDTPPPRLAQHSEAAQYTYTHVCIYVYIHTHIILSLLLLVLLISISIYVYNDRQSITK